MADDALLEAAMAAASAVAGPQECVEDAYERIVRAVLAVPELKAALRLAEAWNQFEANGAHYGREEECTAALDAYRRLLGEPR